MHFMECDYIPTPREHINPQDTTYSGATSYAQICKTRTYLLYQALGKYLPHGGANERPKILDVGLYPGTQIRVLSQLLDRAHDFYGAGLALDGEFKNDMANYLVSLSEVDLDPFYAGLSAPIAINLPDASCDCIYALDIFEHFISPLKFLEECARLMKSQAIVCISTPNVSHIGGIFRMLLGRSNYEALDASPMYQAANKWRGHYRTYDKEELIDLFSRFGMTCIHHHFYHEAGSAYHTAKGIGRLKYYFRKWIGDLIPRYRENHFMVMRKSG